MRVDIALSRRELGRRSAAGQAAVVIDVIRASTTITIALHHGCAGIVPVRTLREARAVALTLGNGALVAGERAAAKMAGADLGNSPSEYGRERVEGKTVVLTTSNGTRAIRTIESARAVVACAFLNVSATARWLQRAGADVLIVCAGRNGQFCLEDAVGGGMLIDCLSRLSDRCLELSDAARAVHLLYSTNRGDLLEMLRGCEWGREITRKGFGADLEVCAQVDLTDVVPVMREGRLVAEWV
ncbi:MAG: 2-phosphosulfolactate phosphatase [Candidatus Methylomirabilis oxyfera]|nr:2-phosphosulfolactate phosphatase [Candidatus Methylomirabilis oxyfera]